MTTFTVKSKHLPDAPGRWSKFAPGIDRTATIRQALTSSDATVTGNPQIPNSFRVVTNVGQVVGTRGEQSVRVIVDANGRIVTAFPVK